MEVIIYSFIKRDKSTKIPTGLTEDKFTRVEGTLKEDGCGIINPVILIDYGRIKSPTNYNYAYITEFERYYYVIDWTYYKGFWYGIMQEDYLATWRQDIFNTQAYILRASKEYDGDIEDTVYPIKANIQIESESVDYPFRIKAGQPALYDGSFVVGIISYNIDMVGATTYYVMTQSQFLSFMSKMLKTTDWLDIDWDEAGMFITQDLLKTLFNPIQYIVSCVWVANSIDPLRVLETNKVSFGWWEMELDMGVGILHTPIPDTYIVDIDIPKHPQASTRGNFLNLSPYSYYQLHVPPYGIIDIPADELQGEETIKVEWVTDPLTAQGRIMVATSQRFIVIVNCMMGMSLPIAQIASNPWQALESIVNTVTTGVNRVSGAINGAVSAMLPTGNEASQIANGISAQTGFATLPFNIINDVVGGIGDAAQALTPTVSSVGGSPNGGLIGFAVESFVRISGKFGLVADEDNQRIGRPLCKVKKLGDMTGFVKTMGAAVSIEGNQNEQAMINTLLDSGVFIE